MGRCFDQDMSILEVKNWKKVALDRDERAKLLKKARAHQGLSIKWWWWWWWICVRNIFTSPWISYRILKTLAFYPSACLNNIQAVVGRLKTGSVHVNIWSKWSLVLPFQSNLPHHLARRFRQCHTVHFWAMYSPSLCSCNGPVPFWQSADVLGMCRLLRVGTS
jgi:hypothetical protein